MGTHLLSSTIPDLSTIISGIISFLFAIKIRPNCHDVFEQASSSHFVIFINPTRTHALVLLLNRHYTRLQKLLQGLNGLELHISEVTEEEMKQLKKFSYHHSKNKQNKYLCSRKCCSSLMPAVMNHPLATMVDMLGFCFCIVIYRSQCVP